MNTLDDTQLLPTPWKPVLNRYKNIEIMLQSIRSQQLTEKDVPVIWPETNDIISPKTLKSVYVKLQPEQEVWVNF